MPADLVNAPPENRAPRTTAPLLRTNLGFRDLLLFYIVTTFSLRWMATAAASGPSALVIWLIAAAGLFVPLVFTTLELSSRYPQEGGVYVWSREAFGPFAGFLTGWLGLVHEPAVFSVAAVFRCRQPVIRRRGLLAGAVIERHLLRDRVARRPRAQRGHERRGTQRRQVAEQRRRGGELGGGRCTDRCSGR